MGTDLTKVRPAADNNLINGKMNFDCSNSTTGAKCTNNAGLSKFQFTSGKKHRLRLINTGTAGIQKFSIDNHKLSVIANDMIQIKPYTAEVVTLAVSNTPDNNLTIGIRRLTSSRSVRESMSLSRQLASQVTSIGCDLT